MTIVEGIRTRPGMYVGDIRSGAGIVHMTLELLGNACDQYLTGRCTRILVVVAGDGTITVEDDGPGFPPRGDARLPPLDVLLTTFFDQPTVDGHRPHVHLGLGTPGLAAVNALSERLELVTVCDGVEARTSYARGQVVEPLAMTPTARASGTSIKFRPDPQIFTHARIPRAELAHELEDLAFLAPGLRLEWRFEADDVAARGLVGLVAWRAACAFDEVARHQARYDTPTGPIEVDVALARPRSLPGGAPKLVVDSFVNLRRTRDDGVHVDGLNDGVRRFLGGHRSADASGLVAAVAVVLSDVLYGNPTRDRLDSQQVREPTAATTETALRAWAANTPIWPSRSPGSSNSSGSRSSSHSIGSVFA